MRKLIFIAVFTLIILWFGRSLNPFSNTMFTFHDQTQAARIQEFVFDIKNLQIPPRLAPHFSFNLGYPVFNFYAPTAYWITSILSIIGFGTINALKLSLLLSILLGFIATYFFLREHFDFFPSLTGAILYISSLYYPLNIFVRGNLGEVWFLGFFPLVLLFLLRISKKPTPIKFFFTVIVISLLITVHNLLSFACIPIILIFILLGKNKKITLIAFILGLLLSSYFILPLIVENHLTYATTIAEQTRYADHFLCPDQLWQSPWGFGGSIKGCNDGMSFKIGKIQIGLFVFGIVFLLLQFLKQKKVKDLMLYLFFITLTLGSLFMTTYFSKPIWDFFSGELALFQFPWRFIAFSLLGMTFIASYFLNTIKIPFKNFLLVLLIFLVIGISSKYFTGRFFPKQIFEQKFLSQEYIETKAAYQIPEYLPRTVNYDTWRTYENKPITKAWVNIHYFPFWNIKVNGKTINPTKFDELGRPIIELKKDSKVTISYKETPIEKIGDFITLFTFGILLYIIKSKKLWNKIST